MPITSGSLSRWWEGSASLGRAGRREEECGNNCTESVPMASAFPHSQSPPGQRPETLSQNEKSKAARVKLTAGDPGSAPSSPRAQRRRKTAELNSAHSPKRQHLAGAAQGSTAPRHCRSRGSRQLDPAQSLPDSEGFPKHTPRTYGVRIQTPRLCLCPWHLALAVNEQRACGPRSVAPGTSKGPSAGHRA